MITYEIIESKIDRLIEQGSWLHYDYNIQAYIIGNIAIHEYNTFVNDINVCEYMVGEYYDRNFKLFEKLDILSNEQDNGLKHTESDIINYLES